MTLTIKWWREIYTWEMKMNVTLTNTNEEEKIDKQKKIDNDHE